MQNNFHSPLVRASINQSKVNGLNTAQPVLEIFASNFVALYKR